MLGGRFQSWMHYKKSKAPKSHLSQLSNVNHDTNHLVQSCNLSQNQTPTCLAQKQTLPRIRDMFTTFRLNFAQTYRTGKDIQGHTPTPPRNHVFSVSSFEIHSWPNFIQANHRFTTKSRDAPPPHENSGK